MREVGSKGKVILDPINTISSFSNTYCTFVNSMFTSVDWIYTYIESMYVYDYKIIYHLTNFFDDSYDFFFLFLWRSTLIVSGLQLFWSVLLDKYVASNLIQLSLTDAWVRSYISSKDASLLIVYHPEILFFKEQIFRHYFFDYLTDINISIVQLLEKEQLMTPIMLVPQLIFLTLMGFILVSFFFSYYNIASNDESTIDADYLSANAVVESEKEIGSFDDIIMVILVFLYSFGWYFYLHCWNLFSSIPEMSMVLFLFPMLYFVVLNIPTLLLYDFGLFFSCFLRGVAPTHILILELLYDYIAIIAFYFRVLVQGIRISLMFFTYASMHDYIVYMHFYSATNWGSESIWESISNVNISSSSVTYFTLLVIPSYMWYWVYEVIHTFFVVTGQLTAYFSMVFWLFFFLFTFFVIEKQESYFFQKKKEKHSRLEYLNKIYSMKNIYK